MHFMNAFFAAALVAISIVLLCTVAELLGWRFVRDYQTLLAAIVALFAAGIAYRGAISNAHAIAAAAGMQIAAMREQRDYDNTIATARMMENRASLLFAIAAELRAVQHAVARRNYVENLNEAVRLLEEGTPDPFGDVRINENYTPIIDAAAPRIGEFTPEIARSIARIGMLMKSAIEQTNMIHEIGEKPTAHLMPIEHRLELLKILQKDVIELMEEIRTTVPVLEKHAKEISNSISK